MRQCQAIAHLGRQLFLDAIAAGWLSECARKPGGRTSPVFYRFADVHDVGLRIAAGEYPQPLVTA